MSGLESAYYVARLVDLLAEANGELDDDDFGDLLVLAAQLVARRVAARLEDEWQSSR